MAIMGSGIVAAALPGLPPAQAAPDTSRDSAPQNSPKDSAQPRAASPSPKTASGKAATKTAAPQPQSEAQSEALQPKTEKPATKTQKAPEQEKAAAQAAPAPAAPEPPTAQQPFDKRIAALVAHKLKAAHSPPHSAGAFYRALGNGPLWVSAAGWKPEAKSVAAEIRRAGLWGLEPEAFTLPDFSAPLKSDEDFAAAELTLSRAVIKYARHAKGGRVNPKKLSRFIDRAPTLPAPRAILDAMSEATDRRTRLLGFHPKHPQFRALKARLNRLRGQDASDQQAPRIRLPHGPVLRRGTSHPHIALLRRRLGLKPGSTPQKFDATVERAVQAFQKKHGLAPDGIVGNGTRRVLNGSAPERQIVKLLINMERWRALPDDLAEGGDIYVWANVPEFRVRIIKNGKTVFTERAIVGLLDKQTPIFSDRMEWIEFHPTWFVPNSIKRDDILPSLRRPTSTIVERYHLRIDCGAAGSDPRTIDWRKVDITKCRITQPAGPKSVLGDFKFKFPNRHSVYMHDTLTRRLFSAPIRTFSHGCIRIKNPKRMAEILLGHQKIMKKGQIDAILAEPRRERKARFRRPVPVHITYLTALEDERGTFISLPDYYGHDRRLAQALLGKGHLIPPAPVARRSTYRPKPRPKRKKRHWTDEILYN